LDNNYEDDYNNEECKSNLATIGTARDIYDLLVLGEDCFVSNNSFNTGIKEAIKSRIIGIIERL
jgi:hypothetical protein